MKLARHLPLLAFVLVSLSAVAVRAEDFVIDDGSTDGDQVTASRVVLINQTGQPKLKVFVSAKPNEKPKPQTELKEADYTVKLSDPKTEVSLYVSTMDNKKKSAIRRAKDGDVLAVVFQDGNLALLKRHSAGK